jgi:hypothetical protein
MRFPRRAPREVYRVFDEDEYLAGATWEPDRKSVAVRRSTELRWPRILSAAILIGTTGAVGGLVLLSSLSHPRGSGRRSGLRMPLAASFAATTIASTAVSRVYPHHWRPTRRLSRAGAIGSRRRLRRPRMVAVDMATGASAARVTGSAYVASETAHQPEFGFEQ